MRVERETVERRSSGAPSLPPVRVHIFSDTEGVAGIVKWEQVSGGEPLYEEGRKLYTQDAWKQFYF